MSLGRLLAAGKSLVGLRGGQSRYREDKQARLPKFISPKNPFAPAEKAAEPVASAETPKVVVAKAGADETTVTLKIIIAPASAPVRAPAVAWFGGWRRKLDRFRARRAGRGPARNGNGEPSKATQTELALDRVRVVRNDLSDADLASNPPSQMIRPVSPVMAVAMEKLEPMGAAWHRLAAKFLGSDQT